MRADVDKRGNLVVSCEEYDLCHSCKNCKKCPLIQILHKSSGKQIDKVVKKLSKQSGRKITWGASEKNWIDFDIPKMKGD